MRIPRLSALALLLILFSPAAWAVDDGQTRPRLSYATLTAPNTSVDIIATINGSGNIKGVYCLFVNNSAHVTFNFFVNGGTAQSITLIGGHFPVDSNLNGSSGWIPYNIRFSSSVRVQMHRPGSPVIYGETTCMVSWALD